MTRRHFTNPRQTHQHPPKQIMSNKLIKAVQLICTLAFLSTLVSCVAGRVDRVEDRYDRRTYSGPGDFRENVNDKFRGRRGIRY
jgi:hypothetical protein